MKHSALYKGIFHRKSIRKYKMMSLAEDTIKEIKSYVAGVGRLDPSIKVDFSYLNTEDVKNLLPIKAPHYICIYSEKKDGCLMNVGFILQQIDLYLSAKGIGSCWLGMAKPVKVALKEIEGMEFVIMLAFGNSLEPLHRQDLSEFKRKTLNEISTAEGVEDLLDPVRFAPSATNSQPWFFTGDKEEIHLHRRKLNMIKAPIYDKMNQMDIGIVAYYLYLSGLDQGKKVDFAPKKIANDQLVKGYEYMISAQIKGA